MCTNDCKKNKCNNYSEIRNRTRKYFIHNPPTKHIKTYTYRKYFYHNPPTRHLDEYLATIITPLDTKIDNFHNNKANLLQSIHYFYFIISFPVSSHFYHTVKTGVVFVLEKWETGK